MHTSISVACKRLCGKTQVKGWISGQLSFILEFALRSPLNKLMMAFNCHLIISTSVINGLCLVKINMRTTGEYAYELL